MTQSQYPYLNAQANGWTMDVEGAAEDPDILIDDITAALLDDDIYIDEEPESGSQPTRIHALQRLISLKELEHKIKSERERIEGQAIDQACRLLQMVGKQSGLAYKDASGSITLRLVKKTPKPEEDQDIYYHTEMIATYRQRLERNRKDELHQIDLAIAQLQEERARLLTSPDIAHHEQELAILLKERTREVYQVSVSAKV